MTRTPEDTTLEQRTTAPATAAAGPSRRRLGPAAVWQTVGPLAVFVALFALVSALNPAFLGGGLRILALQATTILLVALGQAMVLHVGSIDLSNAAMAILSAIVLAMTLGPLAAAAPLVCIALMTAVGAVNGALVAYAQVPSFALTLGTLGILQAAALVVSDATTVYVTANREVLAPLFGTAMVGLPAGFWVAVVLAVLLWVLLRSTRLGQALTAVGLNETGALFSGLRTRRLKVLAFALSGFLAGVAGVMIIAQAGAASSFGLGSDLLLPGIAAAIVGGTAITGGVTNPIGVVFGALTVALIPIAAAAVGVTPQAQSLVYGAAIMVAVALTMTRRNRGVVK
ncbi:ABC transporter permease [Geodermatophilus sp. DSM 45219]|uniref:ABC transporter permease n=1 Tax=Geodermatophilus sp. DSM 45219 TaxID=1881103 RepID=UPI00088FAD49|nr:ABC transporter permease [Geodermatophilus sp. DSM 45219]SDN94686.1 ribose transport system permease protein [Geodermatophilus sp. DSM 45219]